MYEFLKRRYALALYDVAAEKNNVDECISEVEDFAKLLGKNNELAKIVKEPQISTTKKIIIFRKIFKGKISEDVLSFLELLLVKGRMLEIDGIVSQLQAIKLEKNNILVAYVKTVIPMDDSERKSLKGKLEKIYNKHILIKEEIDKGIIGGVFVRVGDDAIDGTVKNRLEEMKRLMLKRE